VVVDAEEVDRGRDHLQIQGALLEPVRHLGVQQHVVGIFPQQDRVEEEPVAQPVGTARSLEVCWRVRVGHHGVEVEGDAHGGVVPALPHRVDGQAVTQQQMVGGLEGVGAYRPPRRVHPVAVAQER